MASTSTLSGALVALSTEAIAWLNGKRPGAPLGANLGKSAEVALGDRLNELSKVGVAQVVITGAATGTLELGASLAGARCVASIADLDGASVTLVTCADADSDGDVLVTLSGTAGGNDVAVSVAYDAR